MAFADTDEERMSYYDVIKMNNQLLMQLINDILISRRLRRMR